MHGDAIRSVRGSASLIPRCDSSLDFFFHLPACQCTICITTDCKQTAKQKVCMELGCVLASSFITMLANIQTFLHTPRWCLPLTGISACKHVFHHHSGCYYRDSMQSWLLDLQQPWLLYLSWPWAKGPEWYQVRIIISWSTIKWQLWQ